jgi:hypothetical protein
MKLVTDPGFLKSFRVLLHTNITPGRPLFPGSA